MKTLRRFLPDLAVLAVCLLLPLLIFLPVALGGKTLIPADNLFQWAPWSFYAKEYQATVPQNELLSDLLLENYAWKRFIIQSIQQRQIPLWNPYLFAGSPFLATGQHSALYPFSLVYYVLPLERAYGVFTVSQLFLAGAFMALFGRVMGMRRSGACLAAVIYQACGFMLVSVDFPMILAASAWLPFLLAMVELVIRQRPALGGRPATLPWVILGACGLGMQLLAGHGENSYFTLLVMGLFAAWRLLVQAMDQKSPTQAKGHNTWACQARAVLRPAVWLAVMLIVGIGLGAVQFIPFFELVQANFREGAASLSDVLDWSYPWRRIIAFVAPNFFGSPSHHSYLDLFDWQKHQLTTNYYGDPIIQIYWGKKNYVEGGAYLGILPLILAVMAVLGSLRRRPKRANRFSIWFFALLALASLTFIFPTGTYAIIHVLPVINQSHSPFRWVFPLSLSVAALAGWGMDMVAEWTSRESSRTAGKRSELPFFFSLFSRLALWGGVAGIAGLLLSRVFYSKLEPIIEEAFLGLALAPGAFPHVRAFYSYELQQLMIASVALLAAGLVFLLARRQVILRGRPIWSAAAIAVVAVDLSLASWGFNPAADPALLHTETELIRFLEQQPGHWRLTTFSPHGDLPLHANTPWLYDLQDVRGYDSIIPKQYVEYMAAIEPQEELLYNRIQPIKHWSSLNSPLLDLLNVKYIITAETLELPKLVEVWAGENLRVYENRAVAPRAFTLPTTATVISDAPIEAMTERDPRSFVIVDSQEVAGLEPITDPQPASLNAATITHYGSQELLIDVQPTEPSWLVLADSYFPGWKAFIVSSGCQECQETELKVHRVNGNFRGVRLEPGEWLVRFVYSPMSFKLGLFISFLAGVVIIFAAGIWFWRYAYRENDDHSTIRRVAKNSLAPMALHLFNRGIDFAYAALALRILGAENAGKYYIALNIAGWFEILSNFGLNTLLMRDVAKEPSKANRYLVNTSAIRLFTSLGATLPIIIYILSLSLGPAPLATDTTKAIVLFMIGMIPGGINTGLTALFYAYEKAEIPAALTTVATILRAVLGTLVLLLGGGFVGLAAVSIIINMINMLLLSILAFRTFFVPYWEPDWKLQRDMVRESFPLMLNHLLATLFFKVDVLLMERLGGRILLTSGNTVVGWYSTAYKWVDALNIIPSFFTFAIFPVLSRQAEESHSEILKTYQLATKLLVIIALPMAVMTVCVAHVLVGLIGGREYLPHGAIALQLMIWSIPIGWINSITNYVLIALGQQRMLTRAFILGVSFNLLANAIFLPRFDYPATAIIAIASEIVLLIAFYHYLRSTLAPIPWLRMLWRPLIATGAMAVTTWLGYQAHWIVGIVIGGLTYAAALFALQVFTLDERETLAELIPAPLKKLLPGSPTLSDQ